MANSVSALLVAFMLANSYDPSSVRSSKPPASMIFALPDKIVSQAISRDCNAVALNPKLEVAIKTVYVHEPGANRDFNGTAG